MSRSGCYAHRRFLNNISHKIQLVQELKPQNHSNCRLQLVSIKHCRLLREPTHLEIVKLVYQKLFMAIKLTSSIMDMSRDKIAARHQFSGNSGRCIAFC